MKRLKIITTIFLLILSVSVILAMRFFSTVRPGTPWGLAISAKAEGNPQARLRIVEYTDFQCPACAKGTTTIKEYLQLFPQGLYVQYRHYPLDMHPRAMSVAIAAECAARQKKFWPFHDLAFGRQNLIRETINLQERLLEIAAEAKMDRPAFEKCLSDPGAAQAVQAEREEGRMRKVSVTPTYFMNEKMVVGNAALKEELEKTLGRLP